MKQKISNSSSLMLHRILVGLADSTIKIFIPLLIYKQTQNVFLAFLFGLIDFFITALLFGILKKIIQKHPILSITLYIGLVISLEFLLLININIFTIMALALLNAFATTLYYGSINLLFGILDQKTNTAKFETGQQIGRIIFSIISVYLIANITNSLLFIVIFSSILYLLSLIPLLINKTSLKEKLTTLVNVPVKTVLSDNQTLKFNIFHVFTGIFTVFTDFILPLYLYINGLSYTVVGILVMLQCVIRILGNYLGGFFIQKSLLKISTIISSFALFVCLLCIMLIKNDLIIYIFILIITLFYQILFTSFFNIFIKDQKTKGYFQDSIFYRDIYQNFAKVLIIAIYLLTHSFLTMFIFAILSSVGIGISGLICLKNKKQF